MKTLLTTLLIISSFALFAEDSLTLFTYNADSEISKFAFYNKLGCASTLENKLEPIGNSISSDGMIQIYPIGRVSEVTSNQQRIQKLEQEIEEIKELINSLKQ